MLVCPRSCRHIIPVSAGAPRLYLRWHKCPLSLVVFLLAALVTTGCRSPGSEVPSDADISGYWVGTVTPDSRTPYTLSITLTQSGNRVQGTWRSPPYIGSSQGYTQGQSADLRLSVGPPQTCCELGCWTVPTFEMLLTAVVSDDILRDDYAFVHYPCSNYFAAVALRRTSPPPPPAAPQNVSVTVGHEKNTINWDPVASASSYNVYWASEPGVSAATGNKVAGITAPFDHSGLTNGTIYYYVVTAVNYYGESGTSAEVSGTPAPPPAPGIPDGVSVSVASQRATISWAAVEGAWTYNLYWGNTPGVTKASGALVAGVVSPYVHDGLINDTPYYYIVTAENPGGESDASVEVGATPHLGIPNGVAASPASGSITISWNSVADAAHYNLYWDTAPGVTMGSGSELLDVSSPYEHSGLANRTTYYYVVTAVDPPFESAASDEVNATPILPAPDVVTATLHAAAREAEVSWNPVPGATTYDLYWSYARDVGPENGTRVPGVSSPYTHAGLEDDIPVYFVVTAQDPYMESDASERVSVTRLSLAPAPIASVSADTYKTLAQQPDGSLWAWGENTVLTPTQVGVDEDWVAVSAGRYHSLALKADGSLWAWGSNAHGQLGTTPADTCDTIPCSLAPIQVGSETDWVAMTAGEEHSLALKADGTLWAWGRGNLGMLGLGTSTDQYSPAQVGTDIHWLAVSAGFEHTLALKSDGSLWAWGGNSFSQLGDGTTSHRYTPVRIGHDGDWKAVAAGGWHSVALRVDGSLWAWGKNDSGALGNGTTEEAVEPAMIGVDVDWLRIAAGHWHTLAIKIDGSLWAWGSNYSGQLGDGTETESHIPLQVGDWTDWLEVAGDLYHSVGQRTGGNIFTWGGNANGQLGDGTRVDKSSPIQVLP